MQLSEINIYPIKSLGGIALNEAIVEEKGLQFDRRWMLVTEKGEFLTQREFPKMATLRVSLHDDGLKVFTAEKESIEIPFAPNTRDKIEVSVWESKCEAVGYDETINSWFSAQLQTNCKLVTMPADSLRKVSPTYAVAPENVVSFADGYPVLLIGESSLSDLNAKLETPIPMNRFRPNLVIKGSTAFAEDGWKKIRIGEAIFHLVKPCARCVMTTIDQKTGEFTGKEPLKTLATYRLIKKSGESKVNFGQNLIAEKAGAKIQLGDNIEVLK